MSDQDQKQEIEIILSYRGNCGKVHPTFEEWAGCAPCKEPPPPLSWRDYVKFTCNACCDV